MAMTEQDWLACDDPTPMIAVVRNKARVRKFRLLAVAACRRVSKLLKDRRSLNGIEIAESFADGGVNETQLDAALTEAFDASYDAEGRLGRGNKSLSADYDFANAVRSLTQPPSGGGATYDGWESLVMIASALAILRPKTAVKRCPYPEGDLIIEDGTVFTKNLSLPEQIAQSKLIRCIFGNPFRPIFFNLNWLKPTVINLATFAYEERNLPSGELDKNRLAILADALEECGCDHREILGHLRGPGPHVRGCHVVDLLLGKE